MSTSSRKLRQMTNSVKTLTFKYFWRSMHWGSSFPFWNFFSHWASKTKAKVHCWNTNCRIYFFINNLGIHCTNIKKIKKNSQAKAKFDSSVNLITNFHLIRQIDFSHILVILMDDTWAWNLYFFFWSLYLSVNISHNSCIMVIG